MVDLWIGQIDQLIPQRERLLATFSNEERLRSGRFIVDTPRNQFIAARGMLRFVLSRYLAVPPDEIVFEYGSRKKPYLADSDIRFNLSHSENIILLGVSRCCEIGVDVEHIHPIPEMATMVRSHFSPAEQQVWFALPPEQRERAFFLFWTRKEAYIKARGDGLHLPLDGFDVTMDHHPRLLRAEGDDPARWRLHHVEPAPGYVGAICIEGDEAIHENTFTPDDFR